MQDSEYELMVCVNLVQSGRTPLMIASFEGHAGVVQVLIEARAQINTQDKVCYSTNIKNNTHTQLY